LCGRVFGAFLRVWCMRDGRQHKEEIVLRSTWCLHVHMYVNMHVYMHMYVNYRYNIRSACTHMHMFCDACLSQVHRKGCKHTKQHASTPSNMQAHQATCEHTKQHASTPSNMRAHQATCEHTKQHASTQIRTH
jgi:hypothetical protein